MPHVGLLRSHLCLCYHDLVKPRSDLPRPHRLQVHRTRLQMERLLHVPLGVPRSLLSMLLGASWPLILQNQVLLQEKREYHPAANPSHRVTHC